MGDKNPNKPQKKKDSNKKDTKAPSSNKKKPK
ncbi:MAG: hypothetical protein K0Q97_1203 [Bacillota bacterium]|jgi:hypothetical protein|nr:hypothetical protein [Bacillota bacterium]